MKVACIGCGVMGSALMEAVCKVVEPQNLTVSDADFEKATAFAQKNGCVAVKTNVELLQKSPQYVFLAVKPQVMNSVLAHITQFYQNAENSLAENTVFVSIAAGLTTKTLESHLFSGAKIIRLMPNMPATVGEAMIALCANNPVMQEEIDAVFELLKKAGKTEQIQEDLMNTATAISGSGPAYAFMFIDSLADAGVKLGLSREKSIYFAAQTLKGAAEVVLQTQKHPSQLKDEVCSPAGTTIEAVHSLERDGFRAAIINAVEAAYIKAGKLNTT